MADNLHPAQVATRKAPKYAECATRVAPCQDTPAAACAQMEMERQAKKLALPTKTNAILATRDIS